MPNNFYLVRYKQQTFPNELIMLPLMVNSGTLIKFVEELVHGRWQPTVQKSCSVWQFRISEPSNHCREWRDLTRINSFCHVVYLLICFLAFFSHAVMSGNLFCWKILRLSGVDSAVFFAIRSSIVILLFSL